MKKKAFEKIKDKYYNKTVRILTFNNKEYIGKYDFEYNEIPIIYVGNNKIEIKNIKKISLYNDKTIYKYVSVEYDDDMFGRTYYYKTTIEDITVGDGVIIERLGNITSGVVRDIKEYTRDNAPYPVDKTKDIIEVIDDEFDEKKCILLFDRNEYHRFLLNNMFGKISIKRLMKLNTPINGEEKYQLFYYPKFNCFFYKIDNDNYKLAEFNSEIITNEMFTIMEEESIKVDQTIYNATTDNNSYVRAILFCKESNIPYYDDTDIIDYEDEKEELYKDEPKSERPKDFDSLDEIITYLENYKEAVYKWPDPSYYIEEDKIIHYFGYLDYDMRVFKIYDYLLKNNLIDRDCYDSKKYSSFFKENIYEYDYDNLDYERISYLIARIYNIERVAEGTINGFAKSGNLLKIIKRLKILLNSML